MEKKSNRFHLSRKMLTGTTLFLASMGMASASPTDIGPSSPKSDLIVASPQQSTVTVTGIIEDQIGPVIGASVVEKEQPMVRLPIWTVNSHLMFLLNPH